MNCKFLCNEWRMAKEIDSDVKKGEAEEMMREKGKEMKRKAKEWKTKATNIGGHLTITLID